MAAAVVAFDGQGFNITDPSIGVIKFYIKQWDVETNSDLEFKEIQTRPCVPSDFPTYRESKSDESFFYPVKGTSQTYLNQYGVGRMLCLTEPENMKIHGNFNSENVANLMVVF